MKFNFLNKNERSSNGLFIRRKAAVFLACLLVVSMMVSPFLLSVSMWGLVFVSFWETAAICRTNGILDNLRKPSAWGKILAQSFRNLFRQPPLALFLLLLIVPAASFFWSDDHVFWLERARVRLPFLVLPWVFANLPLLSLRQLYLPLYVLVWALTIICLVATINFALHFDEVLAGIGRGDPIPVPRSHIRFSLILAAGIVAGGWLWAKGFFWRWKWERWALAAALFFLFFFIHLLSVRSGIVGLYAVLLFSLGRYLWRTRRWGIGLIALAIIILAPMAAMRTLPSFEMRVRYMIWDWQQYQQNKGNTYSDAERIISLKVGWQLWQENPLLGVGAGDLPAEVRRVVNEKYPGYNDAPKLPHNQFVYILSGTGLIGLVLSLVAFLAPIAAATYRRFYLFAAFQILVFTSFLVEYTIETAIGVAFYLFYTLWFVEISRRFSR